MTNYIEQSIIEQSIINQSIIEQSTTREQFDNFTAAECGASPDFEKMKVGWDDWQNSWQESIDSVSIEHYARGGG